MNRRITSGRADAGDPGRERPEISVIGELQLVPPDGDRPSQNTINCDFRNGR